MTQKIPLTEMPPNNFFIPYTLRELHNLGGTAPRKELRNAVLDVFDIPDELLRLVVGKRGYHKLPKEVGWAMSWLSLGGYIVNPNRGIWTLTEKGKKALPGVQTALEEGNETEIQNFIDEVDKLAKIASRQKRAEKENAAKSAQANEAGDSSNSAETATEMDEEQESLDADLDAIKNMDPFAFERLCKNILTAEGYKKVENTKKSNDGGFDGLGYLVFGLVRFKVVFECKRYSNGPVGGRDMRAFIGTMSTTKAHKGIFITTSSFSKDAQAAAQDNGDIELVDGEHLVALLKKHQIATKLVIDKYQLDGF